MPRLPGQKRVVVHWPKVNRQQLSELLGVHPDTVSQYARAGMPIVKQGGHGAESVYDAVACLKWYRQQIGKNAKDEAHTRALTASAKLNELKLERERGDVWPKDQIIREGQAFAKAWSAQVRSLPRRAAQLGIVTPEKEPALTSLCRDVLTEISQWRTSADAHKSEPMVVV